LARQSIGMRQCKGVGAQKGGQKKGPYPRRNRGSLKPGNKKGTHEIDVHASRWGRRRYLAAKGRNVFSKGSALPKDTLEDRFREKRYDVSYHYQVMAEMKNRCKERDPKWEDLPGGIIKKKKNIKKERKEGKEGKHQYTTTKTRD